MVKKNISIKDKIKEINDYIDQSFSNKPIPKSKEHPINKILKEWDDSNNRVI